MDIVDNPEDATIGAFILCELVQSMRDCEDLDDELEEKIKQSVLAKKVRKRRRLSTV